MYIQDRRIFLLGRIVDRWKHPAVKFITFRNVFYLLRFCDIAVFQNVFIIGSQLSDLTILEAVFIKFRKRLLITAAVDDLIIIHIEVTDQRHAQKFLVFEILIKDPELDMIDIGDKAVELITFYDLLLA